MHLFALANPDSIAVASRLHPEHLTLLRVADGWPRDLKTLIEDFANYRDRLLQIIETVDPPRADLMLGDAELRAPIRNCEKLICVGKNYADHAREMGGEAPELPVIFNKFASAINDPGGDVIFPAISDQVDFEAELVVVIGKTGRFIPRDQAFEYVFGYCCGNDISARDWQKGRPGGQWLLGKTFDTFAPLGPMLVTRDEIPDPHNLSIELRLNGETMQSARTSDLIFPIDVLIEHVSRFFTLQPGDLIFTGTPAGVGAGRKPPLFLKPGDQLEVQIDGLGILANQVNLAAS
ncbi:MAG: fumarylacetoacetate hydrolase family protein [Planctomycetota bacterium]